MTDHYATLGVARSASADEIKRAYRKLASQHHPDKGGDVKKFQEIEQAYRVLSDPQQRQAYDNPSPFGNFGNQGADGFAPFDFDTIFDIFGTRFNHQQRRPKHVRMSLWISLSDVASGGLRTVSVGTHAGTQAVEIEIPLGINDGDSVQYPGLAPGGLDLVITYRVHPNPIWQRQGLNLSTEQSISMWDCILGGEINVRDLLNNQLNLTIPPNTQPGTVMRLRNRGLRDRSDKTGDMFIRIQAHLPENISPEILDTIAKNR